jgi:hypothetical protein
MTIGKRAGVASALMRWVFVLILICVAQVPGLMSDRALAQGTSATAAGPTITRLILNTGRFGVA